MKKIVVLLLMLPFVATAQFNIGIQTGATANIVRLTNTSLQPKGVTYSFIYPGIIFNYQLGNMLQIAPSVNYLQTKYTLADVNNLFSTDYTLQHLQVPLDLRIPVKLGSGKLLLMLAPTATFNLKGKSILTSDITMPPNPLNITKDLAFGKNAAFAAVNWGSSFGVGYRVNNLEMVGKYFLGLTDNDHTISSNLKTDIASVTLGYYFIGNGNK